MKNRVINCLIVVIFASIICFSYANKTINKKVEIDDDEINVSDVALIYDADYEMLALKKDFTINNSKNNICAKLYLNIEELSPNLKSEFFKYKIESKDNTQEGNFINAKIREKMIILDNFFIEKNKSLDFDFYIWISKNDSVNQNDLTSGNMKSKIIIESKDVKDIKECKN